MSRSQSASAKRRSDALAAIRKRPTLRLTHDEVIKWLCEVLDRTPQQAVVNAFLVGLAEKRPELCSGLASYAVWRFTRPHPCDGTSSCNTCGESCGSELVPLINMTDGRYSGAPWTSHASYAALDIEQLASEPIRPATDADMAMLRNVLEAARELPPNSRASALAKAVLPGRNPNERRYIIETLGYCRILAPRAHARLDAPIPRAAFDAPHEFGVPERSDWQFPAGAWTSDDGVNTDALAYWFPGSL